MTANNDNSDKNLTVPVAAAIEKKSGLSIVWLLPAIAVLVALWLVYKSIINAGEEIIIEFPWGADIKAHETELIFEGLTMGVVKSVMLKEDLRGVKVAVEVNKKAAMALQHDTVFWLVEPEVSLSRIAGLETLVSGKYITFQLGDVTGKLKADALRELKPKKFHYLALAEAPPKPEYMGGINLVLSSDQASSLEKGTPILFQKINVGMVEKTRLADDGNSVLVDIYIKEEYKHLVNTDTRFWRVGGLQIGGGLGNIKINMESFQTLLIGGITFSKPNETNGGKPVNAGDAFELFEDKAAAMDRGVAIELVFNTGEAVSEGTVIKYLGQTIGEVNTVTLSDDLTTLTARAVLTKGGNRIARKDSVFWLVKPELGLAKTRNLETLVTGQYIAVSPGKGEKTHHFVASLNSPLEKAKSTGLNLVLQATTLGSIREGVALTYRNIEVGKVKGYELGPDASQVLIYVNIDERYRQLIHDNTRFWNASGIGLDVGLFSGAKIRTGSLESMLEGGIALATPNQDQMGELAKEGAVFPLAAEVNEEWLSWQPKIDIPPAE
ncbi:intermembrane transport protein PqiB [Oceanicoccus sp. KOV_DT_Chl]|uniref:PqiB family protein n=1 Tax=Oceanicoccus sp. KOV_DT_Chl TaxID=1904639 RepID=UPI000C79E8FA|nr:MlaD family protein [Oceanicoccus sp. KOV_DT_Chl]